MLKKSKAVPDRRAKGRQMRRQHLPISWMDSDCFLSAQLLKLCKKTDPVLDAPSSSSRGPKTIETFFFFLMQDKEGILLHSVSHTLSRKTWLKRAARNHEDTVLPGLFQWTI